MVTVKETKTATLDVIASGKLVDITYDGIVFDDEETGEQTLTFDTIKQFIGRDSKLKLSSKKNI